MQSAQEFEHAKWDLHRAIVEQAPDAIIFADRDGSIRVWNRGAESIFGYAAAEVLGKSLDVIIPERLRHAHWEGFHRAISTGETKYGRRVLTTRSVHKNGSKLYVDLSFGLVRDGAGAVTGALAVGRDCTARYLAEGAPRAGAAALPAKENSAS
ncbi:MAG TPA: PAS domain S-box protein [Candidatus Udaeobacter sp.]|nr:PAS domain S-box protein [Candidatus Udaeobacter sp.]